MSVKVEPNLIPASTIPNFNKAVVSHGETQLTVRHGDVEVHFPECSALYFGRDFVRFKLNVGVEQGQSFSKRTKLLREKPLNITVKYVYPSLPDVLHVEYDGMELADFEVHSVAGPGVVQASFGFLHKGIGKLPPWPAVPQSQQALVSAIDDVAAAVRSEVRAQQTHYYITERRQASAAEAEREAREHTPAEEDLLFLRALPRSTCIGIADEDRRRRNIQSAEEFLNRALYPSECSVLSVEASESDQTLVIRMRRPR